LDGKHVVFGMITDGLEVLDKIEAVGSNTGKTTQLVEIINCGQIGDEQVPVLLP